MSTAVKRVLGSLTGVVTRPPQSPGSWTKRVAVVVPLSNRAELLPEEEISMRQLLRHLGGYHKYLLARRGLGTRRPGFTVIEFSGKYFGSAAAYNRLMYLPRLYEYFRDYEYILMYHLDALVFSDELLTWCDTGLDYVGAPWIPGPDLPWVTEPMVGNGGFALMKVESILQVLYQRYKREPFSFWKDVLSRNFSRYAGNLEQAKAAGPLGPWVQRMQEVWGRIQFTDSNRVNNDLFWACSAQQYLPGFRLPDWKLALRFAFEACPRHCYELNGRQLPFGCHAWTKFDRAFWESQLLQSGDAKGGDSELANSVRPDTDVTAGKTLIGKP
jgi:hypothetical protein